MHSRRKFLLTSIACLASMALVVTVVVADELLGVITKVDVEGKKLTVVEKDSDKDVVITITDETEQVSKKGNMKVDLEKLDSYVKKQQDAGKKVTAKITHEKNVASKIQIQKGGGKKKSE
jgi:long-subunit acyl-CoA synthetase (AMP-forming)